MDHVQENASLLDERTQTLLANRFGLNQPELIRRSVVPGPSSLADPGSPSRVDLSWISTEIVDLQGDVLLATGMDESVFAANPIVTLNHDYSQAPVGRSLWRKLRVRDGIRGIVAATHYPKKPEDHPPGRDWIPDVALGLVRSGLAVGKSVGFVVLSERPPLAEERRSGWAGARRVIDKWLLLEYAVCWMPANPGAIVLDDTNPGAIVLDDAYSDLKKSRTERILRKAEILRGIRLHHGSSPG